MAVKKLERNFFKTQLLSIDHDRSKIRASNDRHMETFIQLTRKRHETWYRHDKYFREALRKDKDRYEKQKERNGSARIIKSDEKNISSSLITSRLPAVPTTKVERRICQVLRASQKLLDESAARSRYTLIQHRPFTTPSNQESSPTTARSSFSYSSASFIVPMTKSIDCEEYDRLMNESLKRETYGDFVDHFVKFRPEYREQFALLHQATKRQNAIEKLREFNQIYAKTKDKRYHNLINSLSDFRTGQK
jgi:hypothetical protein